MKIIEREYRKIKFGSSVQILTTLLDASAWVPRITIDAPVYDCIFRRRISEMEPEIGVENLLILAVQQEREGRRERPDASPK